MDIKIEKINQGEIVVTGLTKVNSILNYIDISEDITEDIEFRHNSNEYSQILLKSKLTENIPEICIYNFIEHDIFHKLKNKYMKNEIIIELKDGTLRFTDKLLERDVITLKISTLKVLEGLTGLIILKNNHLNIEIIPFRLFIFEDSKINQARCFDLVHKLNSKKSPYYLNDHIKIILETFEGDELELALKEINNNLHLTKLIIKNIDFKNLKKLKNLFSEYENNDNIYFRIYELVEYLDASNTKEGFVEKLLLVLKLINDRYDNLNFYSYQYICCLIKKYMLDMNLKLIKYFETWYYKKIEIFTNDIKLTSHLIDEMFFTETQYRTIFILIEFNKESIPIVETLENIRKIYNRKHKQEIYYHYVRKNEILVDEVPNIYFEFDQNIFEHVGTQSLFIADFSNLNHKVSFDLGYILGTLAKQNIKLILLTNNIKPKDLPVLSDNVATHYLDFINIEDLKIKLFEFLTNYYGNK